MKKALVVLFSLGVVILGSVIGASAGTTAKLIANIPFAFHAGNQLMPAGEYVFDMDGVGGFCATGSNLVIRSRDGADARILHVLTRGESSKGSAYTVTFTRYGNTYFLSKVQNGAIEAGLPKTNKEKELSVTALSGSGGGSRIVIAVSSN
jgi:hypothetical protein